MTTRHYAAERGRLSIPEKLLEVNWGLVVLIGMIAGVGFLMLYSIAGEASSPGRHHRFIASLSGW